MKLIAALSFCCFFTSAHGQNTDWGKVKADLEKSDNPVAFVKTKLKKKYKIDTVVVTRLNRFMGLADSLAYHGKIRKVYGPFPGENILVQVMQKAPNTFYRASQIFIDTHAIRRNVASNLADTIIKRIKRGETTFDDMARIYSMDGSGQVKGDMGWCARGTIIPSLENAILKRKKGEIFKVWSPYGMHVVKITENAKQDAGFALLLRVIL
ncbi:MAG: peptidylprolyl isomerase [Chitinophagaceae bacterium]|nr:peptidylprolyl isomerase [Chitinophagaceae bacterium]